MVRTSVAVLLAFLIGTSQGAAEWVPGENYRLGSLTTLVH